MEGTQHIDEEMAEETRLVEEMVEETGHVQENQIAEYRQVSMLQAALDCPLMVNLILM